MKTAKGIKSNSKATKWIVQILKELLFQPQN